MNKLLLIAGIGFLSAGCASLDDPVNEKCPNAKGPPIHIRYGDSKIDVTNKVKVRREGHLVLMLHPEDRPEQKKDPNQLTVILEGKNDASAWIEAELTAGDGNSSKAVICVGETDIGTYRYLVKVEGVGEIDPRVDVEP